MITGSGWQRALVSRLVRNIPDGFYRNLSWQYFGSIAAVSFGFLYSLLLARALGAAEFGLIALSLAFTTVVFQLVELRLHEAVIRYVAEFWEAGDHPRTLAAVKLFVLADVVTGLLALGVVMAGSVWAQQYLIRDGRGAQVVVLAGISVFFTNVMTATALGLYRVFGDFRAQALISAAGAGFKLLLAIAVIRWAAADAVGVMIAAIVSSFLVNAFLIGFSFHRFRSRIRVRLSDAPLSLLAHRKQEIFRFVRSTYLLSISMIPTKDLDINLLGFFAPLNVVGTYRIAKSFMSALWTLSDPVFLVIYPEVARMWARRQFAEIRSFVKKITVILGGSALAAYAAASLIVPILIISWMGPEYRDAGSMFRWMTWGLVVWAPLVWVNPLLMAAGRPELLLKSSVIASMFVAALYVPAISLAGANGAAFVSALANPAVLLLSIWIGNREGIVLPDPSRFRMDPEKPAAGKTEHDSSVAVRGEA